MVQVSFITQICPQQTNGTDCGVYVLKTAQCLIEGTELTFTTFTPGDASCARQKFLADVIYDEFIDFSGDVLVDNRLVEVTTPADVVVLECESTSGIIS